VSFKLLKSQKSLTESWQEVYILPPIRRKHFQALTSSLQFNKNAAKLICLVYEFAAFLSHGNDNP
jgi:hypothetical protein